MKTQMEAILKHTHSLLGESATYTPSGGSPVSIKLIPSLPDEEVSYGDVIVQTGTFTCDVLKTAVATPAAGDTILYDGSTYVIEGQPEARDRLGLIWRLHTRPQ